MAAESRQFKAASLWGWPHHFCVHAVLIIHVAQPHLGYRSVTLSINLSVFSLASFAVLIEWELHSKPEVCLRFGVYKTINCTSLTHCAHSWPELGSVSTVGIAMSVLLHLLKAHTEEYIHLPRLIFTYLAFVCTLLIYFPRHGYQNGTKYSI